MRTLNARVLLGTALLSGLVCITPFPLFQNMGQASASAAALHPYGGCAAPAHEGITVCDPPEPNSFPWSTAYPFQVIAAATSGRGQVQQMELWADGKKLMETNGTPFDEPVSLPVGTHTLTVIEQDTTGATVKSAPFQVSVEQSIDESCSLPGSPGVNVCSPLPNGCNSQSWVDIVATGKAKTGSVSRMELWIDGDKVANFPGDRINTSLIMVDGNVTINEVDTHGDTIGKTFFFSGPC